MISAPNSSSASLRRPLTLACVPTGIKNGVCTTPCGVFKTPRRAPVGSVFVTSNEKLTHRVYQEKANAHPTRHTTYAAHTPNAITKALLPFSFLGLVAANPIAMRMSVQNVKTSNDLQSATSHFAASSGRRAARFEASGFSRSSVPGGFRKITSRRSGLLTRPGRNECDVIASEVPKFVEAPPNSEYAPQKTNVKMRAPRIGPTTPMT